MAEEYIRQPKYDPGSPPESVPEPPTKEGIDALLTLIADDDDIAVLHRIQQALSIGHKPADADVEVYHDLMEVFGDDLEGKDEEDDDA